MPAENLYLSNGASFLHPIDWHVLLDQEQHRHFWTSWFCRGGHPLIPWSLKIASRMESVTVIMWFSVCIWTQHIIEEVCLCDAAVTVISDYALRHIVDLVSKDKLKSTHLHHLSSPFYSHMNTENHYHDACVLYLHKCNTYDLSQTQLKLELD